MIKEELLQKGEFKMKNASKLFHFKLPLSDGFSGWQVLQQILTLNTASFKGGIKKNGRQKVACRFFS